MKKKKKRNLLRDSRSFHSAEEDTREGHDKYVKRVDDEMRYGNAREQDFNNNRAHNIPNNTNMEHNPGGGSYGKDYHEGAKGGPGRFDQFNDEFDGNYNLESENTDSKSDEKSPQQPGSKKQPEK